MERKDLYETMTTEELRDILGRDALTPGDSGLDAAARDLICAIPVRRSPPPKDAREALGIFREKYLEENEPANPPMQ